MITLPRGLTDTSSLSPTVGPAIPDFTREGWSSLEARAGEGYDAWPFHDRRWYPHDDAGRWVHVTRELMFDSIQRCIARAVGAPHDEDSAPHELLSSDEVFRHLHACASACARELYSLGQDCDGVVAFMLAGATAAADPDSLHPAVLRAIAEWCREVERTPGTDACPCGATSHASIASQEKRELS
jgi:hypothetical protein